MSNTTGRRKVTELLRVALELLVAAGAGVAGVAGIAYFLFAPRIAIGTASSPIVVHQALVEMNFSLGWAVYFTSLAVLMVGIPVVTILHLRTRSPMWRWMLIVVAVLVLLGSVPVDDSLRFRSLIAIAQSGRSLLPGVVLGLFTAIMVFLDSRGPSATPSNELAIRE